MPKTSTKRVPRKGEPVSYNPMFPGGNPGRDPRNAKARVAYGDNGMKKIIKDDWEHTFGPNSVLRKKKAK